MVHARRADPVPAAVVRPRPGHRPGRHVGALPDAERRHPRRVQHLLRRRARALLDRRSRRHAVHHGVDRRAARRDALRPVATAPQGRRDRAQEAQPVHPLPDRRDYPGAGLSRGARARIAGRKQGYSGGRPARPAVRDRRHRQPRRRHLVPDVDRRADHQPRHRQRRVADHHGRDRRPPAAGDRAAARRRPHRYPQSDDRDRRDRPRHRPHPRHLLHGAGPAPGADPISQASDRARDAAGALAPADQDQHRGRDPADLRLVLAADAADGPAMGRQSHRRGWCERCADHHQHLSPARRPAVSRFLWPAHRLLLLLLHRGAVQQRGDGGQSEAPRRLHSGQAAGQGHRAIFRLSAQPDHRGRGEPTWS